MNQFFDRPKIAFAQKNKRPCEHDDSRAEQPLAQSRARRAAVSRPKCARRKFFKNNQPQKSTAAQRHKKNEQRVGNGADGTEEKLRVRCEHKRGEQRGFSFARQFSREPECQKKSSAAREQEWQPRRDDVHAEKFIACRNHPIRERRLFKSRLPGGGVRHEPVAVLEHHQGAVGVMAFVGIICRERGRERKRRQREDQNQMADFQA